MREVYSTMEERAALRAVVAGILRDCARFYEPVPSTRAMPARVAAATGGEGHGQMPSEKLTRRAIDELIANPPPDLRWRCVGRQRQVSILLTTGQWSAFTPLLCAMRTIETNRARKGRRCDIVGAEARRSLGSARRHFDRLSALAAISGLPVDALYR